MAYVRTEWKNREVEYPRRYIITDNGDGTVTIEPSPGNIIEPGTPIIAANMNNIEDGIVLSFSQIGDINDETLPAELKGKPLTEQVLYVLQHAVPTSRRVNNKALTSDITINVSDISGLVSTRLALGSGASAIGSGSVALGQAASAVGESSVALGSGASAAEFGSVALGIDASAAGNQAVALGRTALAALNSVALGIGAKAEGDYSAALGSGASAAAFNSVAIGRHASATVEYSVALGQGASAAESQAVALGSAARAIGNQAVALGQGASAAGSQAVALGSAARAIGNQAVALGYDTYVKENYSAAIGAQAAALGTDAIALGRYASASEPYSVAIGYSAAATNAKEGVLGCGTSINGPSNWIVPGSFTVSGTKNFEIPHPKPEKKATHVIRHSAVESPTPGDTLYRWKIQATKDNDLVTIDLPDYFVWLNKDVQIFVTPQGHFGNGYGDLNRETEQLEIHCQYEGEYNVLVIGTRNDDHPSVQEWSIKGVEREIGESWTGETYAFSVDEILEVEEIKEVSV